MIRRNDSLPDISAKTERRISSPSLKVRLRYLRCLLLAVLAFTCLLLPSPRVHAEATDEIKNFTITVDVNEDASLQMNYHIDWLVLDDSIGKLEWIDLGVPNKHHENITPVSDTVDHIEDNGSKLAIYLDRGYGEGETVSLDFSMTQDHMYQIDRYTEGETVYTFTPAWFDGIEVDQLVVRWNEENVSEWQPDCSMEDGYLTYDVSLSEGEKFTMSVTYPNEAYAFSSDRQAGQADEEDDEYYGGDWDDGEGEGFGIVEGIAAVIVVLIFGAIVLSPIFIILGLISWIIRGTGFGSEQEAETGRKITRTKIEYYETCPGCGAPREEGKDKCPYCGRSMIKSKEVVEEDQIEHPEKYTKNGRYPYGNSGNTFILVNVSNPPPRPRSSGGSKSSRHGGSSGSSRAGRSHHSSCVSSCACACVSSCACACACASSGRAGCSAKDFFKESIHKGRIRIESKRRSRES